MALIKCPDCGNDFSDQAPHCPSCGHINSNFQQPQSMVPPNPNGSPIPPNNGNYSYAVSPQPVKKESGLGITALIFSILGCTFIVGAILAIIDLCKKDDTKKHTLSKVSLIIAGVWLIIGIIGAAGGGKNTDSSSKLDVIEQESTDTPETETIKIPETTSAETAASSAESENDIETVPAVTSNETTGQKNALRSAKSYLNYSAFSYQGLVEQLEYEKYSHEDAVYAADNCGADWNEQALKSAITYLDYSAFSYSGLIEQLEYEGFTHEQAVYGADNCNADWNQQAAKSAEAYLDYSSFSRDSLIDQLEYEGFTREQAIYGAEANGY